MAQADARRAPHAAGAGAKFVDRELMPLEPAVLARRPAGESYSLTEEQEAPLFAKCRELGLLGLDRRRAGRRQHQPSRCSRRRRSRRTVTPLHLPAGQPEPAHDAGGRRRLPARALTRRPMPMVERIPALRSQSPAPAAILAGMLTRACRKAMTG